MKLSNIRYGREKLRRVLVLDDGFGASGCLLLFLIDQDTSSDLAQDRFEGNGCRQKQHSEVLDYGGTYHHVKPIPHPRVSRHIIRQADVGKQYIGHMACPEPQFL
ncbi:hypothetical protein F5146DRAFT_1006602 [Armillaria mellea]|nr:hypothetical protein F5146DRAFT_1006602 [Armillaria mellea]